MISASFILIVTALFCAALGFAPRLSGLARLAAVLGVAIALGVSLWSEGLSGGGTVATVQNWPQALAWLSEPVYRSDALATGLGAWCLLLGGLCLLRIGSGEQAAWQIAIGALMVGVLYSLAHTWELRWFAGQVLLLVLLVWGMSALDSGAKSDRGGVGRQLLALGLGSALLLGAVLLVGRTTGGAYNLAGLSLSALTVWPLVLVALFAVCWLGLVPFTGWSGQGTGGKQALVQSLAIGVPVLVLLLRLEALVTTEALAGSVPPEWGAFTTALAWVGGVTALVAGAGTIVWAGTARWPALLAAHSMGLALWALSLDNPLGRYAGLAIVLAYGAGRVALEMASGGAATWSRVSRAVAGFSLAAAPVTAGFVGVWLLGATLSQTARPSLAIVLAGAIVMAAVGTVLHLGSGGSLPGDKEPYPRYLQWVAIAAGAALLLGGTLPVLWLPTVAVMAAVAGGVSPVSLTWAGLQTGAMSLPLLLLGLGALSIAIIGWLVTAWARSGVSSVGSLLPPGLDRVAKSAATDRGAIGPLLQNPPAAIWWLSLVWLEAGVWGFGALLGGLGTRLGGLFGRLEGRFYLPLALILALLTLLVVTR